MDWKTRQSGIREESVSMGARFLWVLIDSYANRDGTGAHPSMSTLARKCGRKVAWVAEYIQELKDRGWLHVGKLKTKHGWVNDYSMGTPEKPCNPQPRKKQVRGTPEKAGTTIDSIPGNSKPRRRLPEHFLPDEFGGTMRPVSFNPSPPNGR